MSTERKRITVLVQDVMAMLELKESSAYKYLARLKRFYNKANHQYITKKEFAEYTGLLLEDVEAYMQANY